jgi:U3 small nucleolar RNA-associated protein 13
MPKGGLKLTVKLPRGHVLDVEYDATGTLCATGTSDNTVRVYDVSNGYCTHNFRGHEGIVSKVAFHPDPDRLQLFSLSVDSTVRLWDLVTKGK